jgi:hypothetical protein
MRKVGIITSTGHKDDRILFTLLSVVNRYSRVVVGDSTGRIFTLGYEAWQKLVDEKAVATAVSGGEIDFLLPWHMEITVRILLDPNLSEPVAITFWCEPLLGLGVVCAWDNVRRQWYLWASKVLQASK